ncbi:hypothetical protein NQ315_003666 [Exocentrus adspersus]|uniref:Tyr recombinase domain-containing protein n=1 Tax=Exocentrus adspersus TaxID=1586481 RepID=A0AAV8V9Z7_9CUCU|nr:hypothetical protein NQ315_003666 [Exocentrus adspersus]
MEFLTERFHKAASYSSLNTYRSAIAGPDLAQDFRLHRFSRGVYMLRPSLPKYQHTWDPGVVLNCLKQLKNSEISLELLTQKTVTLLALATGQRLQTLTLIEIPFICRSDTKIETAIPKRIKTSARNKPQPVLSLPFLNSDPEICVKGREESILITYKKPIHNATTQTVSRWIKIILGKSGVDITKFSGYSTRHASTSAASRKGLNFDTIRLAAGWSANSKIFATVYNRPLLPPQSFDEAVLRS